MAGSDQPKVRFSGSVGSNELFCVAACTVPRDSAPTRVSCQTWSQCVWLLFTRATRSSSTGQLHQHTITAASSSSSFLNWTRLHESLCLFLSVFHLRDVRRQSPRLNLPLSLSSCRLCAVFLLIIWNIYANMLVISSNLGLFVLRAFVCSSHNL